MVFSDVRFLLFLVALLGALAVTPTLRAKKLLLAAGSCLFYAAWDWRCLLLLLLVSAIGWFAAIGIDGSRSGRGRRAWLIACIAACLSVLGWFKYANFFLENLAALGLWQRAAMEILLPAGISFYTFKIMSYVIDVYRGDIVRSRSLLDYVTFATFFPELIAGPIVRASVFLPQMSRNIGPSRDRLATGASIFLLGLTKKLLVADRLSVIVDPVFAAPQLYSPASVWLAVVAYGAQIYCDFSGYSDMAIGTAKMVGYDLPQNFAMPYLSSDIAEFWRRWHITLSTWLRDYLYIPLGGNRRGAARTYANLMATMLLGGLWHGASWNFILWGGLHGTALAFHRWTRERGIALPISRGMGTAATLLFVLVAWVPFRASTLALTGAMLTRMAGIGSGALWVPSVLVALLGVLVAGHVVGTALERAATTGEGGAISRLLRICGASLQTNPLSGWAVRLDPGSSAPGAFLVSAWLLVLFFFAPAVTSPFIYFQF